MNWKEFYNGRVKVVMEALRRLNPNNDEMDHIEMLLTETDQFFSDCMEDELLHGGPDHIDNVASALYCQIEVMQDYCSNAWNFGPGEQPTRINWAVEFDDNLVEELTRKVYDN